MAGVWILGNGPAGVSAALYTVRAGLETTILKKDAGALAKADKIENYYGFAKPISGRELLENGTAQAERLGVRLLTQEVVGLGFGTGLEVYTAEQTHTADAVILATGSARNAPKIEGLAALEGKGVSYCAVCDAFFYRGKDVAVLGSGEYARHEVQELLSVAGSVTLLTDGTEPQADFPSAVGIQKSPVAALRGADKLESIAFRDGSELTVQGVFVACGVAGSADLAKKIGAVTQGTKIVVNDNMETNIPGLYAAGDCTGGTLQIAKAVYEGMRAGMQVVKYLRKNV